ncbi:ATP-dependent helicase [Kurthia sibirica]|uniref:DNA 3'-5' helicase n=1 Tax=Kurthia sibirica TaxID=202750 RepID=A0A2U3AH78_9BACL|nr:ATP-dependent helicase [Kurthia sibirica]PWI23867.1 DNA helicase UvrD [Kurthia sibirica]GEK35058.1 DNA helicase [Kurthia sibirica]
MNFFDKMHELTNVRLNEVQKQAVRYADGPLLLLASPGSGKTTTLNMKIGYLMLVKKVPASKILAITFSKASASDMEARFEQFFHTLTMERVQFSTIHSFAFKIVREYFRMNSINYQLIEGEKGSYLHKRNIIRTIFIEHRKIAPTEDEMDELLSYISFAKNKMVSDTELGKIDCSIGEAAKIYKAYDTFKKQNPQNLLVDFDDMLTYCYEILRDDTVVRHKYQQLYDYVLTDESQDNSVVQHEIVQILAAPQNNLCVVADDDQSIFMWRGADVSRLLNFQTIYANGKIVTMAQNYRSTKEIVDTANQFIKRNKNRYDKTMFTENPQGKKIEIRNMRRFDLQLNYLVDEIQKATTPKEMIVLYRNNASAIRLIDQLEKKDIPFYMKDVDVKFFRHWIVEDVLNFMRLSYNDSRVDILEKIYPKMNAYIKKAQITQLLASNDQSSCFDQLQKNIHAPYQEQALRKAKKLIKSINSMAPQEAIDVIRKQLGYDKSLKNVAERLGFNEEHLLSTISQLEHLSEGLPNLEAFAQRLKDLEEIMQTSRFNKNENVVTLSTLHSSKGLEFDCVYMIDLIDGIIPSKEDMKDFKEGNSEKMDEAVRLFYVGMTRARHHLELLTYTMKDEESVSPSAFIDDVKKIMLGEAVGELQLSDKVLKDEVVRSKSVVTNKSYQTKKVRDIPKDAIKSRDELQRGTVVLHQVYDQGYVKQINDEEIEIIFDHYGAKKFMLEFCLKQGMLRPLKK